MDSVFLGAAERQTVRIDFPSKIQINGREEPILCGVQSGAPPPMFISDLLGWVKRFASEEGPTLVREGGRRGVIVIQPTAKRLQRLLLGAAQAPAQHIGFSRPGVRRSLVELASQLGQVERLSSELSPKTS